MELVGYVPLAYATLSTTLAIDYDGLIVPAGRQHIDTLKHDAKRVLRAFLREDMPVLLQGDAHAMLQFVDGTANRAHDRAETNEAPYVNGRLVTTAVARNDLAELQLLTKQLAQFQTRVVQRAPGQ